MPHRLLQFEIMRKRVAIVALAIVASACVQDPVIPRLGDQPILLTLAVSTIDMKVGRPDTIRVTATNTFDQGARLIFENDCQLVVTIRNALGAAVVPPNGVHTCLPVPSALDIPAGGSVARTFLWQGGTNFLPTISQTFLPPGTYFISAAINATNYSTIAPAIRVELAAP